MDEIKQILAQFKGQMSWQEMADAISETPGLIKPINRSQINNWGVGVSVPDYYLCAYLFHKGTGWVSHLGLALLEAQRSSPSS